MKKTLLQIVQEILSDMDSEGVNTLSDSVEAEQVASIVETTYYNLVSTREIPEHQELIKLTPLSDIVYPTHFEYGSETKRIDKLWYENTEGFYKEVCWLAPLDFLIRSDGIQEDYTSVPDKSGGTTLRIQNDKNPQYYTSFDDQYIVMDSHDATVETTLQMSKVRAFGVVHPEFVQADDFVPDMDAVMFPYLIAEAKSAAMSLLSGGSDPKVEQAARRQKSYIQNDMSKTRRPKGLSAYGR